MDRVDASSDQDTTRRETQVRYALEFAIENTDSSTGSAPILGALATVLNDAHDSEAYEMIVTGIAALVFKNPRARREARAWQAQRRGSDPTREASAILEIAHAVEKTAHLYPRAEAYLSPQSGAVAVQQLRDYLQTRFGKRIASGRPGGVPPAIPSSVELEEWISKHSAKGARKRFTTVGIVARIVHQASLFGSHGDLQKTRRRVDAALSRARKAERKSRQSDDAEPTQIRA